MNMEVISTLLGALGGASILVWGFAHFLGKIWTDRLAKQAAAKYEQEFERLRSTNEMALEEFRRDAESELKDREYFSGISSEVYQEFFKKRVETYLLLLKLKSDYISKMNEDVVVSETERWASAYYISYMSFRTVMIENQLYVSNELEEVFSELRLAAAEYIIDADYTDVLSQNPMQTEGQKEIIYGKFAENTSDKMERFLSQIDSDVKKLRSRIDIDKEA